MTSRVFLSDFSNLQLKVGTSMKTMYMMKDPR